MRMKTLDNSTTASDPGGIRLSHARFRRAHPELYEPRGLFRLLGCLSPLQKFWQKRAEEHLMFGDSRAALVVSTEPLLVAAYTDELDCIAMLRFAPELISEHSLALGSRLLSVNLYSKISNPAADLQLGPGAYGRYDNFNPMIAEFFSDDVARIEFRKSEIAEEEWQRTAEMAQAYLARHGTLARDGRPMKSDEPAHLR